MLFKTKENEFKIELVFKIIYFILVLISFNTFFAHKAFLSYISYAVVAFGAVIIVNRLTHIKDYLNSYVWLLALFVVSYIISSLTVIRYGILENVQAAVWMSIQFFILFAQDKNRDKKLAGKELNIVSTIFLVYTFVCAIIAFIMMATGYEYYKVVDKKYNIAGGFMWNRLWGCYIDPNYGAVFAIVSILLSLYFIKTIITKKPLKILLILNIILEYLYICFSDSRTGQVALFASILVLIYLAAYRKVQGKAIKKIAVSVLSAILIATVVLGGVYAIQKSTSAIQVKIAYNQALKSGLSEEEARALADIDRIGRKDEEINNGDVSNNRFAIWGSAFEIFKEHPITGISFRNIIEYANAEQPDGFICTSGFESMHNSFVDVMVSQGVIGLIILIALIVDILKTIFTNTSSLDATSYTRFRFIFASIAAIFASMMFYSETFYMNTGGAFLFWLLLGDISYKMQTKVSNP